MALGTPPSISFEKERRELQCVLHSRRFERAPRLAHLLSYLCERCFAGEAGKLEEYSIGVDVFGRGVDYNQDSDSIVRVEVNRLRKRLADYYTGEGADHAQRITIPVGQYVPEFVPATPAAAPEPEPVDQAAALLAQPGGGHLPRRHPLILVLVFSLLGIGAVAGWLIVRSARPPSPAAISVRSSEPHLDLQVGPPAGEEIRILCGATRSHLDHAGKLWSADLGYSGGTAVESDVRHISRTQETAFYRTRRQGQFRYDLPLRPGVYELHLHFAETVYGPELTGTGAEGARLMTVRVNGRTVLSHFDVAADAGASRAADVRVFPDVQPAPDGRLHLEFLPERGDAMVSAIEVLPGLRGRIRPVRILPRQTPYYSNDSLWWSPDVYFDGGQLATYPTPVKGTDDPELYESERWGNFSYAIPVAPGKYTLTLAFAVRHEEWPPGSGSTAHVFNVFCNGRQLLANFNPASDARRGDIVVRRAGGLEPNAQGKLLIAFVPVEGYATVAGIEVVPQ